jgi:hypothetical protein
MDGGYYRPPANRLPGLTDNLMSLSRQHRSSTSAFTQPGFADFSRKLRTCGTAETTKEVITNKLTTSVLPTAVYKIEKPLDRPSETKHAIQNTINYAVNSGVRPMNITEQNVIEPTKEIYNNPLHVNAVSNVSDNRHGVIDNNTMDTNRYIQDLESNNVVSNVSDNRHGVIDNNTMDTDRYIQDLESNNVVSNISSKIGNSTPIENILDISNMPIKDINTISHTAPYSISGDGTTYIHKSMELERNMPVYNANTNKATNIVYKNKEYENEVVLERNIPISTFQNTTTLRGDLDHGSRTAKLLEKIRPGGYMGNATKPTFNRIQDNITLRDNNKILIDRSIVASMNDKFSR